VAGLTGHWCRRSAWTTLDPGVEVLRRHIGLEPIPADAWASAVSGARVPEEHRTPQQTGALELASALVDELAAADALLFALPMYNYGVPQHFKAWVDIVIADPRMAPGVTPVTAGKPAVLAVVQGGNYGPGTPNEGWDHATPWSRHILEELWQLDLEVVTREFTLVGVNPALDRFTETADQLKAAAIERAREHGKALRSKLATA
jgi:FMN-dependent NADH-azoreductase